MADPSYGGPLPCLHVLRKTDSDGDMLRQTVPNTNREKLGHRLR